VRLAEAPSHGLPITSYDPHGMAAEAYRELAGELVNGGTGVTARGNSSEPHIVPSIATGDDARATVRSGGSHE